MWKISRDRATGGSLSLLATLGVIALLYFASSVFITILSSALIALALEPFVLFFCRKAKIGRRVSSMVVGFFAIAFLYGLFYLLYRSMQQFFTDLPILVDQIRHAPPARAVRREGDRSRPPRRELLVRCLLPRPRVGQDDHVLALLHPLPGL